MFFLLYRRCNVEKVPSNSQLEIEGNRSGSVLYSCVSKYRYPLAHHPAFGADPSNGLLIIPPCRGRWRHRCSRPPVAAFVPPVFIWACPSCKCASYRGIRSRHQRDPPTGHGVPVASPPLSARLCLPSRGPLNSALSRLEA